MLREGKMWNYLTKCCDQRQQFLQKGARSSAEGWVVVQHHEGWSQQLPEHLSRGLAQMELPWRHSPGVPGDPHWGWVESGITACRSCVLVESLSSRQEKSCGSRSADCGVAEMTQSCPDLLQSCRYKSLNISCTEGDTGTVWVCLVGKWGLSQWPRLEAFVLSTMTLGPKHAEEMGWQSIAGHSWEVMPLLSSGEKHLYGLSHLGLPKRDVTNWSECHTDPWLSWRDSGTSAIWCEAERQNCSAWRRECSWEKSYPNIWWGSKADKVKLILVGSVRGKEAKGKKLKYRKFLKGKERYSAVGMTEH